MNVTLDGYMSGPDCELDWHFQRWTNEMAESACEQLSEADAILLGRVTYQAMARYWPAKATGLCTARENIDFAEMMNNYAKIVFSKSLSGVGEWKNSRLAKGDIEEEIASLKQMPGKNMIIYGSGKMVSSLMQLKLIDEYRIWLHPVVIVHGKPLFKGLQSKLNMKLYKTQTFSSGVVLLCYRQE